MKFIKDKYSVSRGGRSKLLNLQCRKCESLVSVYQKDGGGRLLRLYLDRIFYSGGFSNYKTKNFGKNPIVRCKKCGEPMGAFVKYTKEYRKSLRLFQSSVIKKSRNVKTFLPKQTLI